MAELLWLPGAQPPQNDGERRVVEYLAKELPGDVLLVPGIQMVHRDRIDDVDLFVLTPWGAVVVEIKDLAGQVLISQDEMVVDRQYRANPVLATNAKARRVKSRLASADATLKTVSVDSLVVLARNPQFLQIHPSHRERVVLLERAVEMLSDARLMAPIADPRPIAGETRTRIREQLGLVARPIEPGERFGIYQTTGLLRSDDFERIWSGVNTFTGEEVELRHIGYARFVDEARRERRLRRARDEVQAMARLQPDANLAEMRDPVELDDGSIVLVSETQVGPSLADALEGDAEIPRREIVMGLTRVLAKAHDNGIVHGRLAPRWIELRPDHGVVLRGFSITGGEAGDPAVTTMLPEDSGFLAPEVLGGPAGPHSDLFGLGKVIEALWDGLDTPDARLMRKIATKLTGERVPRAAYLLEALLGGPAATDTPVVEEIEYDAEGHLEAGSKIGRYAVLGFIGAGSTAALYRAYDPVLGRDVAVKLFRSPGSEEIARREFKVLHGIDHPNVVDALAIDRHPELGWHVAYEYLDGEPLSSLIDAGALEEAEAIHLGIDILNALSVIHTSGSDTIVHRDVKPENVVVVARRGAVLTDFGASANNPDGPAAGTAEYRPPGLSLDAIDVDVDLFAAGIVIHELAAGVHPFAGRDPRSGSLDIGNVGSGLAAVLGQALQPNRSARFDSAAEMRGALLALVPDGSEPSSTPPQRPTRALHRRIEELVEAGRLDEADALCPPEWSRMRLIIQARRDRMRIRSGETGDIPTDSGVIIRRLREKRVTFGWTPARATGISGVETTYEISGGHVLIDVVLRRADNGETWVGASEAYDSHPVLKRLTHGLTIGFHSVGRGRLLGRLTEAYPKGDRWAGWRKQSVEGLSDLAGVDVDAELKAVGALGIGTRELLIGDTSRERSQSAVVFPYDNYEVPVLAYVLTRVVPLARAVDVL
ncbi:MAG: NERD domain-containing protein [Acidimicrobiia bacterium]|nr:MAG: NERD domain-containing protein [Acidimicrobiia bacterium]